MSDKQRALQAIKKLPNSATFGQILDELYFRLKVEQGLRDLARGRAVSHEVARKRLAKWLPK
ncbi:MAG: hypothetical protein U1D55_10770 [Phycisphaerae bacterium]